MPSSILVPPAKYLTLNEARELVPPELTAATVGDDGRRPRKYRSRNAQKAFVLRKAILAGDVKVVARRPDDGFETLNMVKPGRSFNPADGTVFTFVFLRPGSRAWRLCPVKMRVWLPSAEKLSSRS